MITTKTANEIAARTKRMEDAEYCLAHITDVAYSKLEVSLIDYLPTPEGESRKYTRTNKQIDIDAKLLEIFLANIRDYEKIRLDELNNLAVQEAQGEASDNA